MTHNKSRYFFVAIILLSTSAISLGMYQPKTGRFIQQDPIGVRDGICLIEFSGNGSPVIKRNFSTIAQYKEGNNLFEYVSSNPARLTDDLGLQSYITPITFQPPNEWRDRYHRKGYNKISRLAATMKSYCNTCKGTAQPECIKEADKIAKAILRTWFDNYGEGDDYNPILGNWQPKYPFHWTEHLGWGIEPTDSRGGYMCFEWADMFEVFVKDISGKYWHTMQMEAIATGGGLNHSWLDLKLDHSCCECGIVMVDDGYCDGIDFVHEKPETWPDRNDWTVVDRGGYQRCKSKKSN